MNLNKEVHALIESADPEILRLACLILKNHFKESTDEALAFQVVMMELQRNLEIGSRLAEIIRLYDNAIL